MIIIVSVANWSYKQEKEKLKKKLLVIFTLYASRNIMLPIGKISNFSFSKYSSVRNVQ